MCINLCAQILIDYSSEIHFIRTSLYIVRTGATAREISSPSLTRSHFVRYSARDPFLNAAYHIVVIIIAKHTQAAPWMNITPSITACATRFHSRIYMDLISRERSALNRIEVRSLGCVKEGVGYYSGSIHASRKHESRLGQRRDIS